MSEPADAHEPEAGGRGGPPGPASSGPAESEGSTRERILDGALAALSDHGLGRLALEDVARYAGVSRQTLYRYFGSRDALLSAAILREEEAFIERIVVAAARHGELRPALEAAVETALVAAREHPLLDRLLATEPEALLPFLTTGRGPVLPAAEPVLVDLLTARLPHLEPSVVEQAADALTRLLVSYVVNPPDRPVEHVATTLADWMVDGLKSPPSPADPIPSRGAQP